MNEGRVKTRPTRVNIQRGEASQEGCNVVPHNATSSELPPNIEESEPSTPLLTPLIMPSPQPLDQGQIKRGRGGGRGREQGRGYRVPREGPSNISEMQVYDRRPQRKKKVPSCGTH